MQGAQAQITQFYLQLHQCLPLPRKRSPDGASPDWGGTHLIAAYYSFIYHERMKGWVGLTPGVGIFILNDWYLLTNLLLLKLDRMLLIFLDIFNYAIMSLLKDCHMFAPFHFNPIFAIAQLFVVYFWLVSRWQAASYCQLSSCFGSLHL